MMPSDKIHFTLLKAGATVAEWDYIPPSLTGGDYACSRSVEVGSGYSLKASVYNTVDDPSVPALEGSSAEFAVSSGATTSVSITCFPAHPVALSYGTEANFSFAKTFTYDSSTASYKLGDAGSFSFCPTDATVDISVAATGDIPADLMEFMGVLYDSTGSLVDGIGIQASNSSSTTSYALTPGSTYYLETVAVTGVQTSLDYTVKVAPSSTASYLPAPASPSPSDGGTLTSFPSSSVPLSWSAVTDPKDASAAIKYIVYLEEGTAIDSKAIHSRSDSTSWEMSLSFKNDTTYAWKVVAYGPNGSSLATSAVWTFKTPAAGFSAPTNLVPADAATVAYPKALTWDAVSDPTGSNVSYRVYLYEGTSLPNGCAPHYCTTNSFSYPLKNGATYVWKVVAFSSNGEVSSPVQTFTVSGTGLEAPAYLSPANGSSCFPQKFSWSPVSGINVTYSLYSTQGNEVSSYNYAEVSNLTVCEYSLPDYKYFEPGTTYAWEVLAFDDNGSSLGKSSSWTFTPPTTGLAAPANVSYNPDTKQLAWDAVTDGSNAVQYAVYYRRSDSTYWQRQSGLSATSLDITNANLPSGSYKVAVVAYGQGGSSYDASIAAAISASIQ
jgi:hypothetical protein